MAAVAERAPASASSWEDEVAALLAAAPMLVPAAQDAVCGVLLSLLGEGATDAGTRADVAVLLAALGRPVLALLQ